MVLFGFAAVASCKAFAGGVRCIQLYVLVNAFSCMTLSSIMQLHELTRAMPPCIHNKSLGYKAWVCQPNIAAEHFLTQR